MRALVALVGRGRSVAGRLAVLALVGVSTLPVTTRSTGRPGEPERASARAVKFVSGTGGYGAATGQVSAHDGKFWIGSQQIKLRGVDVIPDWTGTSPGDADFAKIASWGMNFARFQVRWAFIEPTAPTKQGNNWVHTYDANYVADLKTMITQAYNHGLYSLVDNAGKPGPSDTDDWWPQWLYQAAYNSHGVNYTDPDTSNGDYWSDALQQQFTKDFWTYLAGQLANTPGIVGYEMLNEPQRGYLPNAHTTTQTMLGVSLVLGQAVRAVDPARVIFFMTRGCCGEGLPNADLSGFVTLGNVALDFHDYYGGRWGAGLLMDADAPDYGEVLQQVDRFTLSAGPYLGTTTGQVQIIKSLLRFTNPAGIPLLVGEFSGDPPSEPNTATLMGTMTSAFNDQGVSWALFGYDGRFGIVQEDGTLQPWAWIVIAAAKAP